MVFGKSNNLIGIDSDDHVPNAISNFDFIVNNQINRVAQLLTFAGDYVSLNMAEYGLQILEKMLMPKLVKSDYEDKVKQLDAELKRLVKSKSQIELDRQYFDMRHRYLNQKFGMLMDQGTDKGVLSIKGITDEIEAAEWDEEEEETDDVDPDEDSSEDEEEEDINEIEDEEI